MREIEGFVKREMFNNKLERFCKEGGVSL